jgi:hypothetical protein
MKVEVRIHKEDLRKVVEVAEDEFDESGDTSTNTKIREFLLEQLEDEYKQVETVVWIDGGNPSIRSLEETQGGVVEPHMKVSKKNGSYECSFTTRKPYLFFDGNGDPKEIKVE